MKKSSFSSIASPIHRLDPRIRLVVAFLYTAFLAAIREFDTLLLCLGLSLLLIIVARLSLVAVFRRLILVNGMVLVFWLILPLTTPGASVIELGPISLSQAGVVIATRITLKSNSILLALIALVSTCPLTTVGYAMKNLGIPEKLVYLFMITCRYLFELEIEFHRLMTAARIRCFKPGNNLHTYRTFAYLFGMLFVRASVRGERVFQAMRCRGFNGRLHILKAYETSISDWVFLGVVLLAVLLLGMMEWGIVRF